MRSLQVKFSALVVTLLTLACVGLAWIATRNERHALEEETGKRAGLLATNLASAASSTLLNLEVEDPWRDDLTWNQLLGRWTEEDGVVAARLLDHEGVVRASVFLDPASGKPVAGNVGEQGALLASVDGKPVRNRMVKPRGNRLLGARAMTYGDRYVGEAQVELDMAALVDPVVQKSERQLALVAAAVILLGVVAGVVFVAFLVEPLRRLRSGVERLASGDFGVRVPPSSQDEVGELTRAFNAMGESLQQKERIQKEFGRYVSDYVVEQLLRAPEGAELQGAEREVTILFADLRRFTEISEGMKAAEVVALLNDFFELASDCILGESGTIDKFIGDSVMAYFGAPVAQPDHAERAVAVAIELQRAVADRNAQRHPPGSARVRVEVGIGIHTGPVVVGNIGSRRRTDFTAIGDVVNVAHRLEKLAKPGEILVSEAVQRCVRGAFRLRFEGERQLSGRREPVHVYAVEPTGAAEPA